MLVYPALFAAAFFGVLLFVAGNFIPAFCAREMTDARTTISRFFSYIIHEHINIPFYAILARVMHSIITGFIIFVSIIALFITVGTGAASLLGAEQNSLARFFSQLPSFFTQSASSSPDLLWSVSLSFIAFITLLIAAAILSYLIALKSVMYAVSVSIMRSNPEHSVHRAAACIVTVIAVFFAGVVPFSFAKTIFTVLKAFF